jgi:hypothetical protein
MPYYYSKPEVDLNLKKKIHFYSKSCPTITQTQLEQNHVLLLLKLNLSNIMSDYYSNPNKTTFLFQ